MVDATRSPTPGRELAALGRDGRAVAMLEASVPLSRREAQATRTIWGLAEARPLCARPKRPRHARSRIRTREIVASII